MKKTLRHHPIRPTTPATALPHSAITVLQLTGSWLSMLQVTGTMVSIPALQEPICMGEKLIRTAMVMCLRSSEFYVGAFLCA